jgi:large subunit ribosomal protein L31
MREKIHPNWYPNATITCLACGKEWTMGSTQERIRVDICSNCHPFYTGEQKIVDTEGMVDKFLKRLQDRDQRLAQAKAKAEAKQNANVPLDTLGMAARYVQIFNNAGINQVSELIAKFQQEGGEEELLALPGIGVKIIADAKRKISEMGYKIN